ncbi:MAG: hypothetical protein ACKVW3_15600 [Phycisphaerales bacterium]
MRKLMSLAMVAGAALSLWSLGGCAVGPQSTAEKPNRPKTNPAAPSKPASVAPAGRGGNGTAATSLGSVAAPNAGLANAIAISGRNSPGEKQDLAALMQESADKLEAALKMIDAGKPAERTPSAAVNTGLPTPVSGGASGSVDSGSVSAVPSLSIADLLAQTLAADWGGMGPGLSPARGAIVVGLGPTTDTKASASGEPRLAAATNEVIITGNSEPPKPLPERIEETTLLLVDLLRQQSTDATAAAKSSLALAALEALHPGALLQVITPAGVEDALTPEQRQAIETFRAMARAAGELPMEAPDISWRVTAIAEQALAAQPMRISNASLCTKVSGFGQFVPVASTKFAAGRANRVIVYVEVDNFAYRTLAELDAGTASGRAGTAINTTDRWAVELSQELQLRHEPDGLLVWARPEQRVLETSRNRRRDFFLVDDVTFPATLSIGRYSLKVITRDKTSNATDEKVLTFDIVADSPLALEPRGLGD